MYLPEKEAELVGYLALISAYHLEVPLPDILSAISQKHRKYQKDNWLIFTLKHKPADSLQAHLVFALKYEGVNLSVLSSLFKIASKEEFKDIIRSESWGQL